jgi:hypothetical protein
VTFPRQLGFAFLRLSVDVARHTEGRMTHVDQPLRTLSFATPRLNE